MLGKSEVLMSLNSKQKSLCQLATAELFTNEAGKQHKSGKRAFGPNAEVKVSRNAVPVKELLPVRRSG